MGSIIDFIFRKNGGIRWYTTNVMLTPCTKNAFLAYTNRTQVCTRNFIATKVIIKVTLIATDFFALLVFSISQQTIRDP